MSIYTKLFLATALLTLGLLALSLANFTATILTPTTQTFIQKMVSP